jgi:Protein of unknown function (DUF1579)
MSEHDRPLQVKAVAAGLERTSDRAAVPGSEHRALDVFIGKWINVGHTVSMPEVASVKIVTSDIYEWAPGGFFVIHSAYGLIGEFPVGGVEIISYDLDAGRYRSQSPTRAKAQGARPANRPTTQAKVAAATVTGTSHRHCPIAQSTGRRRPVGSAADGSGSKSPSAVG